MCALVTKHIKNRKCLKCKRVFPSHGAGNRLCHDCSKMNQRIKEDAVWWRQDGRRA
jgi:hypothetical protein